MALLKPHSSIGLAVSLTTSLLLGAGCVNGMTVKSVRKLTVAYSSTSGFKSLIQDYRKNHPQVKITTIVEKRDDLYMDLVGRLDEGKDIPDIIEIEESHIGWLRDHQNSFVNLFDVGVADIKNRWFDWKWKQSLSADGTIQIGLGTDVGGLGMCYRRDLFAKAGLPTSREAVATLWPTWEAYVETGRVFGSAVTSSYWLDSSPRLFQAVLAQQEIGYYNAEGNSVLASHENLKKAFDLSLRLIALRESAELKINTPAWAMALQSGTFATMMCSTEDINAIREKAPDTRGMWDMAAIPGNVGNRGGSFLVISKKGRHLKDAYQLASWLTAPEQQLRIFKETGNLPSQPALYNDPAVKGYRSEFLSEAPLGQIFADSMTKLPSQYIGPKTDAIRKVIENTLIRVETGELSDRQAWATALTEATAIVAN